MIRKETSKRLAFTLLLASGLLSPAVLCAATAPTITTLTLAPGTHVANGTTVTLRAQVSAAGAPVIHGLVTFCNARARHCEDVNVLGQAQVTATGVATLKLRPGIGTHAISAHFVGTYRDAPSTSPQQILGVYGKDKTATTLAVGGSQSHLSLTAGVSSYGFFPPTGTIQFADILNPGNPFATATLGDPTVAFNQSSNETFPGYGALFNSGMDVTLYTPPAIGDFNGDGIPDMVETSSGNRSFINVLFGNGDGTFQPSKIAFLGNGGFSDPLVADYNEDGNADIAYFDGFDEVILLGDGKGNFSLGTTLVDANFGYGPELVGDFNHDGIPDIAGQYCYIDDATENGQPYCSEPIYFGRGDGTYSLNPYFQPEASFDDQSYNPADFGDPVYTIATDINNDGLTDYIAMISEPIDLSVNPGAIYVYANGKPAVVDFTSQMYPTGFFVADVNQDGYPDIVGYGRSRSYPYGNMLVVAFGKGDGTFPTSKASPIPALPQSIADFNGDGIPDILASEPQSSNSQNQVAIVLLGKGDGTFAADGPADQNAVIAGPVVIADFNGDGVPDYAQVPTGETIAVSLTALQASATAANVTVPGGGARTVYAYEPADATHYGSFSETASVSGTPIATTTTLTISPGSPVNHGSTVQLTATLAARNSDGYNETGVVSFLNGLTVLGTGTIANGQAVFSTNSLQTGTYHLTAKYSGDTNFAGSVSAAVALTVN